MRMAALIGLLCFATFTQISTTVQAQVIQRPGLTTINVPNTTSVFGNSCCQPVIPSCCPTQVRVQPTMQVISQPVANNCCQPIQNTCCQPISNPCCQPYYPTQVTPVRQSVIAPRVQPSVCAPIPANQYLGNGILGQPKVYVDYQPVRNFLRFITP